MLRLLIDSEYLDEREAAHDLHHFILVGLFRTCLFLLPDEGCKVLLGVVAAFLAGHFEIFLCRILHHSTTEFVLLRGFFFLIVHFHIIESRHLGDWLPFLRLLIKDCLPNLDCFREHFCTLCLLYAELQVFKDVFLILVTQGFSLCLVHCSSDSQPFKS